jgi:hypothetical protein
MSERKTLEVEVAQHAERVREIVATLQRLESAAGEDPVAPRRREAGLLRMELVGRTAAVEIGTARLKFLRD